MNTLKKSFAVLICFVLMVGCFTGCHQKGEIAVKVGNCEFTSGYYACALVIADTEARSKVESALSEKGESTENIVYYKQKVEDTDYTKWVEDTALETLKEVAAARTLCKEAGIELDDETASTAKRNAEYMWDTYGYSKIMEPNGVAKTTFVEYMTDSYLANLYFNHVYGAGGEKEISAEKLSEQLSNNYVLVNKIEVNFDSKTDDDKKSEREKLTTYETELKNGTKTFEDVYLDYNNISAEDHKHDEPQDGETAPLDSHATVIGSEDTSYASDYYTEAKSMAVGEIKVVTLDNDAGIALIVKKDIMADPYYIENFDETLRRDIAGDECNDYIEKYGNDLKTTVHKSATGQFKVKKIKYPEK